LGTLSYKDINVGKNVNSAILRYLKGNSLNGNEKIVSEYAFSGLVTVAAAEAAFSIISPERVFISHGTYVDWGPALHTALSRKIPVIAWMASYLKSRFYLRNIDDPLKIDFHNLTQHAWEECAGSNAFEQYDIKLNSYLNDRYKKNDSFDMKQFTEYAAETEKIRQKYILDSNRPVWGIVAHINWDAVSDYSPMAYKTFDDWLLDTIKEIIEIKDVQWLIKIHPAEAWDNPESGAHVLIRKHFPSLPEHIRLIPALDKINPLNFFNLINGGVTVYGTSGLEMALLGKPVILAGEAHYGGKGFTYDSPDKETYRQLLRKASAIGSLDNHQKELARKYAYCYFIQRQIPMPVVKNPDPAWWEFQYDKMDMLLLGNDPFMDFICERIMDGKDFIMDEKLVELAERF